MVADDEEPNSKWTDDEESADTRRGNGGQQQQASPQELDQNQQQQQQVVTVPTSQHRSGHSTAQNKMSPPGRTSATSIAVAVSHLSNLGLMMIIISLVIIQ